MAVLLTFVALGVGAMALVARPVLALMVMAVLLLVSALLWTLFGVAPHWASALINQSAAAWPITLAPLILGVLSGVYLRRSRPGGGAASGATSGTVSGATSGTASGTASGTGAETASGSGAAPAAPAGERGSGSADGT